MAEEGSGFLGRWARRKTDALQGRPLEEPATARKAAPVPALPLPAEIDPAAAQPPAPQAVAPPEKPLSLDDVKALTGESDFKPFMARSVGADVRNAALKKLFADPRYNVMDGLDIYIGDYSTADPIPESMLRQMAGARLLKIFDEPEESQEEQGPGNEEKQVLAAQPPLAPLPPGKLEHSALPAATGTAPCGNAAPLRPQHFLASEPASQPEPLAGPGASPPDDDHAHSHLRLQPDHAPSAENAGRGAP